MWEMARKEGFEVTVFDRNYQNKEKEVDVALSTQIMEDSFLHMQVDRGDRVVLVSGDRDYLPTLRSLDSRGIPTTIVFWSHAMSHDLREFANNYFDLDGIFDTITRSAQ